MEYRECVRYIIVEQVLRPEKLLLNRSNRREFGALGDSEKPVRQRHCQILEQYLEILLLHFCSSVIAMYWVTYEMYGIQSDVGRVLVYCLLVFQLFFCRVVSQIL